MGEACVVICIWKQCWGRGVWKLQLQGQLCDRQITHHLGVSAYPSAKGIKAVECWVGLREKTPREVLWKLSLAPGGCRSEAEGGWQREVCCPRDCSASGELFALGQGGESPHFHFPGWNLLLLCGPWHLFIAWLATAVEVDDNSLGHFPSLSMLRTPEQRRPGCHVKEG